MNSYISVPSRIFTLRFVFAVGGSNTHIFFLSYRVFILYRETLDGNHFILFFVSVQKKISLLIQIKSLLNYTVLKIFIYLFIFGIEYVKKAAIGAVYIG